MMLSEDCVTVVGSFLSNLQDLLNLQLTCKPFYEASCNSLFWGNLELFSYQRDNLTQLVENIMESLKKDDVNKSHVSIFKTQLKTWKVFHMIGYNLFSHPMILDFAQDNVQKIEFLHEIGYPLSNLRFLSFDKSLSKYLALKNQFSMLHFAVWTKNVELCDFLVKNKLGNDYDMIGIQPFVYALRIGNLKIIEILMNSFLNELNNKEKDIISKAFHIHNFEDTLVSMMNEFEIQKYSEPEYEAEEDDEEYFESCYEPTDSIVYKFNDVPRILDHDQKSDSEHESLNDPLEEGISIHDVFNKDEDEIMEESMKFEKVHRYNFYSNVECLERTPHQKVQLSKIFDEETGEKKSKIQKLEEPQFTRGKLIIPKYDFNPLVTEVMGEFLVKPKITPLASLMLQEASEKFIEEYHREMNDLQELGISNERSHQIFFFLFQNELNNFWTRRTIRFDDSKNAHYNPFLGCNSAEPVKDSTLDEEEGDETYSESSHDSGGEFCSCDSSEDERDYFIEDDSQYDEVVYEINSSFGEIERIVSNQKKRETIFLN
jgi:hypothetical protein